jgi:hypothetical protein
MKNRLWLAAMFAALLGAAVWAQSPPTTTGIPPDQQKRLDTMKSKSVNSSLTILPVRLGGRPWDRVSQVVGVLLEKQGLKNIVLGKMPLAVTNASTMDDLSAAVGAFVQANPVTTDYALYAEFNGTRQTGLNEIRAVVVDKTGAVVWTERTTSADEAFKKWEHPDPMDLSVLLVEQLSPQLGLNEETAKAAKPGKLAALMEEQSGLPSQAERDASLARQKAMKQEAPNVALLIYPARVGGNQASVASAANVVRLINEAGLCKAVAVEQSVLLKSSQADPNEQKILWDLAREFRDYIRAHPPETDYALYADYAFNPQNADQGFVHFIVCDRKGEWVIVDFQNSHWPDYQSVGVTSRARCDKLLVKRLEGYLR